MDTLIARSDLLVDLRDAGQAFLDNTRNQADAALDSTRMCELVTDARQKDVGHAVITQLVDVESSPGREEYLDKPVFMWNGSTKDPVVLKEENQLVNTSECFPPALTLLALDYIAKGYGEGDTIYDRFVKKTGALFLCEATPRDFQSSGNADGVGFYFRDPQQPSASAKDYIVASPLFFKELAAGNLPGLDIHDIAHHASQMGLYGDFYRGLAAKATPEVLTNSRHRRQEMLVHLVLNTSLEHSLVGAEDGVQSFGCLNWQAPRKSIMKTGVSDRREYRLHEYPFGAHDFNQWSAVRAIASIYRGQIEAEQATGARLDWMRALGYDMNSDLLKIVRPFESYDYSGHPFDAPKVADMKVPETPEELFSNCRNLIEEEFSSLPPNALAGSTT